MRKTVQDCMHTGANKTRGVATCHLPPLNLPSKAYLMSSGCHWPQNPLGTSNEEEGGLKMLQVPVLND